jgi:hypothetical protein
LGDKAFDESFGSPIATTWRLNRDSLALCLATSAIPDVNATTEHTGGVTKPESVLPALTTSGVKEGETPDDDQSNQPPLQDIPINDDVTNAFDDDDDCPDLVPRHHDDDSVSETDDDSNYDSASNANADLDGDTYFDLAHSDPMLEEDISPQPANISRYGRVRRPNSRYANQARSYEWEANVKGSAYEDLAHACAIEATPIPPNKNDALSWKPAPATIRDMIRMPDGTVKQEWLKSVKKELKTLVESNTFQEDTLHAGEVSTPVIETFKVKVKSDGSLDKLTCRTRTSQRTSGPQLPPSAP